MAASIPVWFITGASSGFGKGIAVEALSRGHKVIATARNKDKIEDLKKLGADTFSLDVTADQATLEAIAADAQRVHGRLDILINAAGYILEGSVEETTPKETFDQFNTNVFGTLNVTRALLPYMREQKSGVVATFGSLGSWTSGPAFVLYSATKWACSAIGEGLRPEIEPFGIKAVVIEPGYFRSNFLNAGARVKSAKQIKAYDDSTVGHVRQMLDQVANNQPGDVAKGCKVIVDVMAQEGVAKGREIPLRLCLGSDIDAAIRDKLKNTETLLDEWHDVVVSTDYPKGQ